MKVQYKAMFPDEFSVALDKNPLAYLPLGAMEFHGWHNVLGLDSIKAKKICQLAAERTGGIVLPVLSIGYDLFPDADSENHPNKKYDCYHIDPELYVQVLEQYFKDIFKIGFKKLFVLTGHYPNKDIAQGVAKGFNDKKIWVKTEADLIKGESGDHAGKWETSLMMAMFPEYVDINKGDNQENPLLAVAGEDPKTASVDYGQQALNKILGSIEALVK